MGIFKKRSIASLGKKKSDMPEGLWNKCPSCGAIIDEITSLDAETAEVLTSIKALL